MAHVEVMTRTTDEGVVAVTATLEGAVLFEGTLGAALDPEQFAEIMRQALTLISRPLPRPEFPAQDAEAA